MPSFSNLLHLVTLALTLSVASGDARMDLVKRGSASDRENHVAVARAVAERDVQDGVYSIPLIRRSGAASASNTLLRRGAQSVDIDIDTFAVELGINGKKYPYNVLTHSDLIIAMNVKDDATAWNPAADVKAKKATPNGPKVKSDLGGGATQYKVTDLSIGNSTLHNIGLLYGDSAEANDKGEPVGDLGFGLPGSTAFHKTAASSVLKTIYDAKAWAKPIFSLALNRPNNKQSELILGAESAGAKGAKPFWQSSHQDRWAVNLSINGHKGVADLATNTHWIIAPPDVATELIKKVGLTPEKNKDGDIVGKMDCAKQIGDTKIDLDGGSLLFTSDYGAVKDDPEGSSCTYIVKGVEQGDYPTPYTFGMVVFYNYNVAFDFTSGKPRVGFVRA